MSHRNRLIAAAAALSVAFLAPLLVAAPAGALTTGDDVLFYSNGSFTDVTEEDANMIAALQASGATVTPFDGGDGSLVAWSAALTASVDALVIPENGGVWASLITDVQDLITQWVEEGGNLVLGYFASEVQTVSDVTGLDYASVWASGGGGPFALQTTDPALSPEVDYANGTSVIDTSGWDAARLAIFTSIYADGSNVAVGVWSVGSGSILGFGWDWYPDVVDVNAGTNTPWNTALTTLVVPAAETEPEPDPDPELAETGAEVLPLGAAAVVLLFAGALAFSIRRRTTITG